MVTTGESVYRDTPLRGAILTRVAASHIRVGTFEYAARLGEESVRTLADYTIERHDPEFTAASEKYIKFFRAVADRQAALVARWQLVGFVHGVMNTDNVAVSGETIDYGPCAFMDAYDPGTVFSSIDRVGRYAYGNQPQITQWNLARFAETLLPLFDSSSEKAVARAVEVLEDFPVRFESYWLAGMRRKLGLQTEEPDDVELIQSLLDWMKQSGADYTRTFRDLSEGRLAGDRYQKPEFQTWYGRWARRLGSSDAPNASTCAAMKAVNPAVIPRNHRVEEALSAAELHDDLSVLDRLLAAVASPYEPRPGSEDFLDPTTDARPYRTFCGT